MTVLKVEARLLTQSDYHVTPAFSNNELFILRDTKAVALAILTDASVATISVLSLQL